MTFSSLSHLAHLIPGGIGLLFIIIATYIIKRIILKFLDTVFDKAHIDPAVKDLVCNTAVWLLYAIALILGLENLGIKVGPLASTLGITGLTIGLAVKDMLTNIAAGILILIYQPFKKGDYIKVKDKDFEGYVKTINIRHTILENGDIIILIPNNVLYSGVVAIKKHH